MSMYKKNLQKIGFYLCASVFFSQNLLAMKQNEQIISEHYCQQLHMIAKGYYDCAMYSEARSCYEKLAEQNDPIAQYQLGEIYRNGFGIDKNIDLAIKYYNISIVGGDVRGIDALGKLSKKGNVKAFESLKFHADSGNIMAYYMLQVYANNGCKKAIEWLENTASKGNVTHQSKLGRMYLDGLGVEKNFQKAFLWSQMAAENGDIYAQHRLGVLYLDGIDYNYEMAFKWLEKSAKRGHLPAFYDIARLAEQKYLPAFKFIEESATSGNIFAKCVLGYMYMHGKFVDKNISKAIELFKTSEEIPTGEPIKHLEEIAENKNTEAIQALKEIASKEKPYRLFTALNSLEHLAEHGNKLALESLVELAEKEYIFILFGAANRLENLAKKGSPGAIEALEMLEERGSNIATQILERLYMDKKYD